MKKLTCIINVGKYEFDFVHDIEIVTSWAQFIYTAKITLPQRVSWEGKPIYGGQAIFKPADPVKIQIGYDYQYHTVFEGSVKSVSVRTPIVIDCVGLGYSLKNTVIKKYSEKNVSLSKLLADISPIPAVTQGIDLGAFRITNANLLEVVENIKKNYALQAFIRGGKLYCGLPATLLAQEGKKVKVNLVGGIVSDDDLTYQRADEVKLKCKAISIMRDNSRIEYETGDADGDLRTLNYYNLSADALKKSAENDLQNLKFEGYRGSFEAFGEPFFSYGDICVIADERYPEREGSYLVKAVTYRFGVNGFRQKVELERKM